MSTEPDPIIGEDLEPFTVTGGLFPACPVCGSPVDHDRDSEYCTDRCELEATGDQG